MYRKDNTDYTFVIEPVLNEVGKVHLWCFKRDKEHNRKAFNSFWMNYQVFRAALDQVEVVLKKNGNLNLNFVGGSDGERMLQIVKKKDVLDIGFVFPVPPNSKDKDGNDREKLMFFLKNTLDITELLNLRTTINNWELANINKLMKQGYDGFHSSSSNKDIE